MNRLYPGAVGLQGPAVRPMPTPIPPHISPLPGFCYGNSTGGSITSCFKSPLFLGGADEKHCGIL